MSQIDLSTKIKKTMKQKNITQQELAKKLKITQPSLSAKLSKNNFTLMEIDKIFTALDYEADIVLCDKSKKTAFTAMHWNINNRFSDDTPIITLIEILKTNADIVVLTEYYKTNNYLEIKEALEEWGYKVFLDPRDRKKHIRQVCIAIKKNMLISYEEPKVLFDNEDDLFGNKENDNDCKNQMPNFMSIKAIIKDRSGKKIPLVIIGTRIRIANSKGDNNEHGRIHRKGQFENLIKQINKLKKDNENIIVLGDFNIGANRYVKDNWNYEKDFKNELDNIDFAIKTPEGNSYSMSNSKLKLDHLLLSKSMQKYPVETQYCQKGWKNSDCRANIPDHAILRCTFYDNK